jgi:hypothetical protein
MSEDYGTECVIQLANGNTIRTDTYDSNPAGSSYVRVCAADGREIAYWTYTEWAEDPQLVMGAILGAASSQHARPKPALAPARDPRYDDPPATTSAASDQQLTAWIAAACEARGYHLDAPADVDLDALVALAASVLDEHGAAHPIRTMGLWPGSDGRRYDLITVDQPGRRRVCLLPVGERSLPGGTIRQALTVLLEAARGAAAQLDTPGQDEPAGAGGQVPEQGTVLTYGDEDSAWVDLGDLVHDVFSRQASDLNNSGLLAQIVYLVQELGPAETQAALTEAG